MAVQLQHPIPPVPVPLRHPDADVVINLTEALRRIYQTARYERRIDYRTARPPPDLNRADAAWLDALLHERGLRG